MAKKRGAQPGNRNAYRHGFYSQHFSPFEHRSVADIPATDLSNEIGLLRVYVNRFVQAYNDSSQTLDYDQRLTALRAVTLAIGRLASLERIQSESARALADYDAQNKQQQEHLAAFDRQEQQHRRQSRRLSRKSTSRRTPEQDPPQ